MPVSPLLTVFRLLPCRAATVSTGDVFLLLRLGLYLVVLLAGTTATTKRDAILQYRLEIVFLTHNSLYSCYSTYSSYSINDGKAEPQ